MNYKKNYEFLITVYITNFNYGEYIEKSIESVLNQTIKNFELIIIDDGSTDRSLEILKKYENNKDIKFIKQKNKGLNVTNNIALRISKGKYIIRLDADDWLEKKALELLSNHLGLHHREQTAEHDETHQQIGGDVVFRHPRYGGFHGGDLLLGAG